MERLRPASSVLVIIDVQERLLAAMPSDSRDAMVANIEHLLEGARLLDVPVVFTEQYPKGLGPTVESLSAQESELSETTVIEKTEFDATQVPDFMKCLSKLRAGRRIGPSTATSGVQPQGDATKRSHSTVRSGNAADGPPSAAGRREIFRPARSREQVVVTGMEAHVCVHQTVRGLRSEGFQVHVPFDATCSRDLEHRRIAEGLWKASGATVTCAETVLFDWLGGAGGDAFKAISKRLR